MAALQKERNTVEIANGAKTLSLPVKGTIPHGRIPAILPTANILTSWVQTSHAVIREWA